MSRRIAIFAGTFTLLALSAAAALAATPEELRPDGFVSVSLPPGGPLELVRLEHRQSRVTRAPRALSMDLRLSLTLRNRSNKIVEGIAVTLGYGFGTTQTDALNAVTGIRVEPGAIYEMPANMSAELEQPAGLSRGELPSQVRLRVDAVLFADGSTFGPDQMRSLSAMRINQTESARDRSFFQGVLSSGGLSRLIPALEKFSTEVAGRPQTAAYGSPRIVGGPTAERARATAHLADFQVVRFAGAPLEITTARARVYEGGLVDPSLEVRNVTAQEIADFQVAWILRDTSGAEFHAATLSGAARTHSSPLAGGEIRGWTDRAVLATGPTAGQILSGRVYLRAVYFKNGQVWVPEWRTMETAGLLRVLSGSPETLRLMQLYRTRGAAGVTSELRPRQ